MGNTYLCWVLGPSWPQEAPRPPPKKIRGSENGELSPPHIPQVGAQNRSKSVPRAIKNIIIFLIDLKIDFWSDLVPTWLHLGPQSVPKWSQVGSQMDASWGVDLKAVFERILASFLMFFYHNIHGRSSQKH